MREKLEKLLEQLLESGIKGRSSSKSHLKSALYDWRVEQHWDNPNALILDYEGKGYAFITFTKKSPRHCTLRHIFVLEDYRGQQVASKLLDMMYAEMEKRNVVRLRFFADIPSAAFYEKLGYEWHGTSKTGLPFFFGTVNPPTLIDLPKSQERYVHST